MQPQTGIGAGLIKRTLLALMIIIVLVLAGVAVALYMAYRQQTAVLMTTANQLLRPYGVEVLHIGGLRTGLRQARIDDIEFRLPGQAAVQRIHHITLDYELRTLVQGQFQLLSADSGVLQLQHAELPDDAFVSISGLSVRCQSLSNCRGHARISASIPRINSQALALQTSELRAGLQLNFDYQAPALHLNVEPGLQASLALLQTGPMDTPTLSVEQLTVASAGIWRLALDTDTQELSLDGRHLQLKAPVIRNRPGSEQAGLSGLELRLSQLSGQFDGGRDPAELNQHWSSAIRLSADFEIADVYTTIQPYNLWSYRWPVQLLWEPSSSSGALLQASISAVLHEQTLASLTAEQDIATGQGRASLSTELPAFSPSAYTLSDLISPLPLEANIIEGELKLSAGFSWQQAGQAGGPALTEGLIQLQARELTGFVGETAFAGLSTAADLVVRPDFSLQSAAPIDISIAEIDPGITLSNIETSLQLDTASGAVELSRLQLSLFGGTLESEPARIHLPFLSPPPLTLTPAQTQAQAQAQTETIGERFELRLSGLDISQLLSLSAYDSVSATGLVDGVLPMRLQGLKPVVQAGQLATRPPGGSIRYGEGAVSGNPNLDLVYQALEHYQYETMTAYVDYDLTGELTLAMQLQGVSPNVNNGQRINLNLNISDNIPALLQSLQAAQNITDRLGELLQ